MEPVPAVEAGRSDEVSERNGADYGGNGPSSPPGTPVTNK